MYKCLLALAKTTHLWSSCLRSMAASSHLCVSQRLLNPLTSLFFALTINRLFGTAFRQMLPVLGGVVARLDAQGIAYGGADVLESALNTVLDAIEDHDNPNLDELVDGNCSEFRDWVEGDEMPLHWSRMHEDYVGLVEEHIGGVLESLECSAEDVFMYAQAYSGGDERIQRLIGRLLATVDLQAFCAMMRVRHEILELFG